MNQLPFDVVLLLPFSFACTTKTFYNSIPNHDIDWIHYYVVSGIPHQVLIVSKWEYIIHPHEGWISFVHLHKKRFGYIIITNVTTNNIATCEALSLNLFLI